MHNLTVVLMCHNRPESAIEAINSISNQSIKDFDFLVSDNSTNNNISFMPFWNNKTLHLIIDTNIGATQDFNENVFTSGTTYKVT